MPIQDPKTVERVAEMIRRTLSDHRTTVRGVARVLRESPEIDDYEEVAALVVDDDLFRAAELVRAEILRNRAAGINDDGTLTIGVVKLRCALCQDTGRLIHADGRTDACGCVQCYDDSFGKGAGR